jgi:serine/threonine protein kinase
MTAESSYQSDIPDMQGEIVGGKYRVVRLIGTGGMGTVWEGLHAGLGHKVAIKFIKPAYAQHPDARKRFEIEARAAARLTTKHAVQVYDFGVTDRGLPYIVMEYLEGRSLSEILMEKGPLTAREVGVIIGQASRALSKAHAAGIVHRDLKPDNIFLATNVEDVGPEHPYSVKLVDFGIAKIVQEPTFAMGASEQTPMGGPTLEGAVVGTPNFMSPEQLTVGGAPGPLTDLWSLGACAFTAMTARIPFEGEVLGDIVLRVCVAPMPVPSQLNRQTPSGFDAWFARACNRDPAKRYQSAQEMGEALELVCGVAGRSSTKSLPEEEIQYQLRPASPDFTSDEVEVPNAMSPRTAMLAGLVLGLTLMVGVLGAIAWRSGLLDPGDSTAPSVQPPPAVHIPPPVLVTASSPLSTTVPEAGTLGDAGKPHASLP